MDGLDNKEKETNAASDMQGENKKIVKKKTAKKNTQKENMLPEPENEDSGYAEPQLEEEYDSAGHRKRLRERYLENGLDALLDHEVLEFLLFYTYARNDTKNIARRMIKEFGSLCNLFEADPREISKRCNVAITVAVLVSLVPPIAQRYLKGKWRKKELLDTSKKAGCFAIALFTGCTVENFYMLCLNNQSKLICAVKLFEGSVTETHVYPREIVSTALKYQAVNVILAHNHPGGILAPSRADIDATKKIIDALKTISVQVKDHIIVAGQKYYSFSEKRTMPEWY